MGKHRPKRRQNIYCRQTLEMEIPMTYMFCPECGTKLAPREIGDEGHVPYCVPCGQPHFSFSQPCVLCVVVDEHGEVALIKQSYAADSYIAVAGYIQQGETMEECARREVEEELGLNVDEVIYYTSFHFAKKDLLMLGSVCKVKKGSGFVLSQEVDEAKWFSPQEATSLLTSENIKNIIHMHFNR